MLGTAVSGRRAARACARSARGWDGCDDCDATGKGAGTVTDRELNSAAASMVTCGMALASTDGVGCVGGVVVVAGVRMTSGGRGEEDLVAAVAAKVVVVAAAGRSATLLLLEANCNADDDSRFGDTGLLRGEGDAAAIMVENVYTDEVVEGARVWSAGTGAGTADGEGVGIENTGRIAASDTDGVEAARAAEVVAEETEREGADKLLEVTEAAGETDSAVGSAVPTKRRICGEVLDFGDAKTVRSASPFMIKEQGEQQQQQHHESFTQMPCQTGAAN